MSADFDETEFPSSIAQGSTAGSATRVDVLTNDGGYEHRNLKSPHPLSRHNVGSGIKSKAAFDALYAFWLAREGKTYGFLYWNWLDHEATGSQGVLVSLTNTTWQMYKQYPDAVRPKRKKIQKPKAGTISVAGTGTYTVDATTGIVTKTAGADPTGTWTGSFYEACRFDTDLTALLRTEDVKEWSNIVIVEYPLRP